MMTTIVFPAFSGRAATCAAAAIADPDEMPLLGGGPPSPLHRRGSVDVDDLVVDVPVEDLRDEVRADALDLVRTGLAAVEDGGLLGLHGDHLDPRLATLEHLADPRDRPPGPDAGHDDVDGTVGVLPDLLRGRLAVDLGVCLVGELPSEDRALALGDDLLGARDRALHALGAGGEDELGAVGAQEGPALLAHRLRHGEDDLVAASGPHHGQGDAGVPRRRLDDGAAGRQLTGGLRGVDDRDTDAVLDRARRAVELELGGHGGVAVDDPVEPDERGVADGLGHVVEDGHRMAFRVRGRGTARPGWAHGIRLGGRRRGKPSSAYVYSNRELSLRATMSRDCLEDRAEPRGLTPVTALVSARLPAVGCVTC